MGRKESNTQTNYFRKLRKMSQKLSSAAVVIGALRVKLFEDINMVEKLALSTLISYILSTLEFLSFFRHHNFIPIHTSIFFEIPLLNISTDVTKHKDQTSTVYSIIRTGLHI